MTLTRLTLKVRVTSSVMWSKYIRNLSETEQSPAELLIIWRIFAHVMSRCDLDLWPLDLELLQLFRCHACTKLGRNRIRTILRWVIDDLARFPCAILGEVGHDWQTLLRGACTHLHQTCWGHRAIIPTQEICFNVQIYCCIFKYERLKMSDVESDAKFRTFWPPVKIRGGVSEKLLPTTEPPKYIWWPSTAWLLSALGW